mmetsp:Transcript_31413/g.78854  ORF Transcript_31413/g.78854 Transcript_31413/m.78854 type:complete len:244 (+) Transcript_31413:1421-2152(+)
MQRLLSPWLLNERWIMPPPPPPPSPPSLIGWGAMTWRSSSNEVPPWTTPPPPPLLWSVAVKKRKRSSTWWAGYCLSERRWRYSSGSSVARSLSSGGRPSRSLAKKKPASGRSTRIPSYTALPRMAPMNSSLRKWSGPARWRDAGLGYSVRSGVSTNRPGPVAAGSKASSMKALRKSLKRPPPSTPASSTPCWLTNWTRTVALSDPGGGCPGRACCHAARSPLSTAGPSASMASSNTRPRMTWM